MRTILMIRHGATELNNDDVSVDRIRGWKDIPLSEEGRKEAKRIAEKLKDSPPDVIFSSDLKRAHDTAKEISKATGAPIIEASKGFRPWDVGDLAGQTSQKAIPILADYAENKPDKKVAGGESFNEFRERFFGAVSKALDKEDGVVAIVAHHRNERLLKAWIKKNCPEDGDIDIKEFNRKGEPTGSAERLKINVPNMENVAE